MYRQTTLTLISVISSIVIWFLGAIFPAVSLFVTCDVMINSICAWLMFRFNDRYWNKIVNIFCYCNCNINCNWCQCICGNYNDCCQCNDLRQNMITRMDTFGRSLSLFRNIGHGAHTKDHQRSANATDTKRREQ